MSNLFQLEINTSIKLILHDSFSRIIRKQKPTKQKKQAIVLKWIYSWIIVEDTANVFEENNIEDDGSQTRIVQL
jgi:hypothetical protein